MFSDKDFTRDRASDAYKMMKPTDSKKRIKDDIDSDGGEEENGTKANNFNKIFGG
jgi:hypothetical protein